MTDSTRKAIEKTAVTAMKAGHLAHMEAFHAFARLGMFEESSYESAIGHDMAGWINMTLAERYPAILAAVTERKPLNRPLRKVPGEVRTHIEIAVLHNYNAYRLYSLIRQPNAALVNLQWALEGAILLESEDKVNEEWLKNNVRRFSEYHGLPLIHK